MWVSFPSFLSFLSCARSASRKDGQATPPHPSEAVRCASTEDHQASSPSSAGAFEEENSAA